MLFQTCIYSQEAFLLYDQRGDGKIPVSVIGINNYVFIEANNFELNLNYTKIRKIMAI